MPQAGYARRALRLHGPAKAKQEAEQPDRRVGTMKSNTAKPADTLAHASERNNLRNHPQISIPDDSDAFRIYIEDEKGGFRDEYGNSWSPPISRITKTWEKLKVFQTFGETMLATKDQVEWRTQEIANSSLHGPKTRPVAKRADTV